MKSLLLIFGILLCVLFSDNIAQAECAWVLWMRGAARGQDVTWDIIGGFPTFEQCQKALIDAFKDMKKEKPETEKERVQIKFTFVCLPDTVDPRK